jgi:hypothetical protein
MDGWIGTVAPAARRCLLVVTPSVARFRFLSFLFASFRFLFFHSKKGSCLCNEASIVMALLMST